jgi:hypothetical protein
VVPYAWQPVHAHLLLSPRKRKRSNGLGFFKRDNPVPPYLIAGTVDAAIGVACFHDFCVSLTKKTVGGRDNASLHTSEQCHANVSQGEKPG